MSNDELAALADTALEGLDLSDTITDRRVARSLLREALGLLADGPHALDTFYINPICTIDCFSNLLASIGCKNYSFAIY